MNEEHVLPIVDPPLDDAIKIEKDRLGLGSIEFRSAGQLLLRADKEGGVFLRREDSDRLKRIEENQRQILACLQTLILLKEKENV